MIVQLTTTEPEWLKQARCSARLAKHFTGMDVEIHAIDGDDWPLEKLRLMWETSKRGPFMFMDTDIAFVRPWDPQPWLARANSGELCVASACYAERAHDVAWEASVGWDEGSEFINSGLVIAGPAHTKLFERAAMLMVEHGKGFWNDEGPINLAAKELDTPIAWLPEGVNVQTKRFIEPDATAIHYMDQGCRANVLARWCIRFGLPTARKRGELT